MVEDFEQDMCPFLSGSDPQDFQRCYPGICNFWDGIECSLKQQGIDIARLLDLLERYTGLEAYKIE